MAAVTNWAKDPFAGKLTARIMAKDGYHLRRICISVIAHLAGRDGPQIWTS
jgi:urease accessory protein UreH